MGTKGKRKHLKREPAPRTWPIHRKNAVWTVRPTPGPHPISDCIPLTLVVRDVLKVAETRKEAKIIISHGKLVVNGKVQREERFPLGLMDVVSVPETKKAYRVLPSRKGLVLHPIKRDEAQFKLCRIEGKSVLKGGHVHLHLHDGTNVIIRVNDPTKPVEDTYHTKDSLKLTLPTLEFDPHMELTSGAPVLVIGGKNIGRHGVISSLGQKRLNAIITIKDETGKQTKQSSNTFSLSGIKSL